MNRIICAAFSLFATVSAYTQELQFDFHIGYGYYQMEELRLYNQQRINQLPIDPVPVEDFSPFIYFKPSFNLLWNKYEIGLTWIRRTTGSRYSLKDYSGEYLLDTRITSTGPGVAFNYCVNPRHPIHLYFGNEIGLIASKATIEEVVYIFDNKITDDQIHLKSRDFSWEPGIKVTYPLFEFQFHLYAGYGFLLKGKGLHTKQGGEKFYIKQRGENVHAGWNGFRWGGGIALNFHRLGQY